MKKISAILLLSIYLFSATEIHQLLKLPVIFQHFREHQQEDKRITLLQFLAIHYLHGVKKDKDYDRDMKLPFKTSCDSVSSVAPAFVPIAVQLYIDKPLETNPKKKPVTQDRFSLSSYLASIWQPPKSC